MRGRGSRGLEEIDSPPRFRGRDARLARSSRRLRGPEVMHAGALRRARAPSARCGRKALVCSGPIRYVGQDELQADIDNLKAALAGDAAPTEAFMTAISPSNLELYYENRHYASDEEYLAALGEAMRVEYQAIVDAGLPAADRRSAHGDALQPRRRTPRSRIAASSSRCASRRSTTRCAASRRTACASTPATASTSRRACTISN